MVKLIFGLLSLSLTACSTPTKQNIDFAKLKPEDRVYTGIVQVDLNGKTNKDLTCDLFLNSDIAPTVRLAEDGIFQFKSNRKKLNFSKIACIHKVDNNSHWVRHKLGLPRVEKTDETKAKVATDLGVIDIKWTINDSELQSGPNDMIQKDPMRDIGKLEVKSVGPSANSMKSTSPQI